MAKELVQKIIKTAVNDTTLLTITDNVLNGKRVTEK